jgi:hypothetical protein
MPTFRPESYLLDSRALHPHKPRTAKHASPGLDALLADLPLWELIRVQERIKVLTCLHCFPILPILLFQDHSMPGVRLNQTLISAKLNATYLLHPFGDCDVSLTAS